jgi:fructosamine-3-kinase
MIPDQKPSLCHGDFWINNIFRKPDGTIYVIDPAIHYGLPEADLAMSQMYEVFPDSFYEGYREVHSLLPDWKERLPLYQLKEHLLMMAQFEHPESIKAIKALIRKFT